MRMLMVLLVLGAMSCKIQHSGSGAKKLHKEQGQFREYAQVEKDLKKQRDKAASAIKEMCGSALDKRMWVGDDEVTFYKGFFVAEAKSKTCDNQLVTIGAQAAKFMQVKSISCYKTHDDYLRFEIPQSPHYYDRIKVTCDTKLVDLRSDGSTLTITTLEENGGGNLATIDSYGKWDGGIKQIAEGISAEDLSKLRGAAETAAANNVALKDRLKWLKVVGAGYLGYAGAAAVATGHLGGNVALAVAGLFGSSAAAYTMVITTPAVVGVSAGVLLYFAHAKKSLQRKEELIASALLMRRSTGVMLTDFKAQLSK